MADESKTLRQYAAIHLRQPISGLAWLDDAIRAAQRDELASRAITGAAGEACMPGDEMVSDAYSLADAVLAARNRRA